MNITSTQTVLGAVTLVLTLSGCAGMSKTAAAPAAPPPVAAAPAPAPAPAPARVSAPAPAPIVFVISDVNFEFDKSTLTPKAEGILSEVVAALREQPGVAYVVNGHTDSRGSTAYNQGLSERRANSVRDYLINHGIPVGQTTAHGFSELRPVATNDTDSGRAENRRVEIRQAT